MNGLNHTKIHAHTHTNCFKTVVHTLYSSYKASFEYKLLSFKDQSDFEDEPRYTRYDSKIYLSHFVQLLSYWTIVYIFKKDTDEGHHLVLTLTRQLTASSSPQKPLAKSSPL